MIPFLIVSAAFLLALLAFSVFMLWRNEQVYRFRTSVANEFVFAEKESWPSRLNWWKSQPDYQEMVRRFWHRLPDMLDGQYADAARAALSSAGNDGAGE